jgi:hypothetical protein
MADCAQEIHKFIRGSGPYAQSPGWRHNTLVVVHYRAGRYTDGGTGTSVINFTEWMSSEVNPHTAKDDHYHKQRRKLFNDKHSITLNDMQAVVLRINYTNGRNHERCRKSMLCEVFVRASKVSKLYED